MYGRISFGPEIDEHYSERMAKKQQLDEWRDGDHQSSTEQQHKEVVGRVGSEAALFEHSRVSRQKENVKEKRKAKSAEEQKGGD